MERSVGSIPIHGFEVLTMVESQQSEQKQTYSITAAGEIQATGISGDTPEDVVNAFWERADDTTEFTLEGGFGLTLTVSVDRETVAAVVDGDEGNEYVVTGDVTVEARQDADGPADATNLFKIGMVCQTEVTTTIGDDLNVRVAVDYDTIDPEPIETG